MIRIFFLSDSSAYCNELYNVLVSYKEPFHEKYIVEKFVTAKDLYRNIPIRQPQIVILNEPNKRVIDKLLNTYPFIPVIVYGDFDKEKNIKKLLQEGVTACIKIPFDKENVISVIKQTLWQGLAKPDLWNNQLRIVKRENRTRKFATILTSVISIGIVIGLIDFSRTSLIREKMPVTSTGPLYAQAFRTPYNNPTGIAIRDKNLWVCSWQTQSIYKHIVDKNFAIEKIFSFPEIRFSDVTFTQGHVLVLTCDPWTKKIYKHSIKDDLRIVASSNAPGDNPTGIAYDGNYIWICDNATDRIYKLDDNFNLIKSYDAPGPNPISICYDSSSKILWSADSETNKIYRHRIDDKLSVHSILISPEYIKKLTGITVDKDYLWICSEKDRKIYKYPKKLFIP